MTALPLRANTGLTTFALRRLSRISTSTIVADGHAERQAGQGDRLLQRRREGTAGDFAAALSGDDLLMTA
jgi:hypothetical protein